MGDLKDWKNVSVAECIRLARNIQQCRNAVHTMYSRSVVSMELDLRYKNVSSPNFATVGTVAW